MYHGQNLNYHAFRPGEMLMVKSVTRCTVLQVAVGTGGRKAIREAAHCELR